MRQKTRWVHGIAFQGWDRLGWQFRPVELWMALRDRRGPLTALVLGAAYLLLAIDAVLILCHWALEIDAVLPLSGPMRVMLIASSVGFVWRAASRAR